MPGKLRSRGMNRRGNSRPATKRRVNSNKDEVFKDLHFVITYSGVIRTPLIEEGSEQRTNESSSDSDVFVPDTEFKNRLIDTIRKHGGIVHERTNEIPMDCFNCSYIISDVPSQTCNFLLGLCIGIPAYHHNYIFEAVNVKKYFPVYLADENIQPIPNGWSVETRNVVFRSPTFDHRSLFSGIIIYLALSNEDKSLFIESILRFCGAIVYTSWTNGVCESSSHQVYIMTDCNCPLILSRSNVPKLSIYWLVQCLITESVRPIDGHLKYYGLNDEDV